MASEKSLNQTENPSSSSPDEKAGDSFDFKTSEDINGSSGNSDGPIVSKSESAHVMGWDNTAHEKWESGSSSKGDTHVLEFTGAQPSTQSGEEELHYTIELENMPGHLDFII